MSQCILFDCDGTLVDSEPLCNLGLKIMFEDYGVELDTEKLVRRFRGWKLAAILDVLAKEHKVMLKTGFVDEYRALVAKLFETNLQPIESIESALNTIDRPKAVVSSGPRHKIQQALNVCGLSEYFGSHIYSSYELNAWKPNPEVYQLAADAMGYPYNDCIVVDDGPVGVTAGYKAGMRTYFFNRFDEKFEYPGVISFTSMRDLPGLIEEYC